MPQMTKGEREELKGLARARANAAKLMAGERAKELMADVEAQLAAKYDVNDAAWRDLTMAASAEVRKADALIAKRCEAMGIPAAFRPHFRAEWYGRGENAMKDRRAELRRVAKTRIDAAMASALVKIEVGKVEVLTKLAQDALESSAAHEFLTSMPQVQELMPRLDIKALPEPGARSGGPRLVELDS